MTLVLRETTFYGNYFIIIMNMWKPKLKHNAFTIMTKNILIQT